MQTLTHKPFGAILGTHPLVNFPATILTATSLRDPKQGPLTVSLNSLSTESMMVNVRCFKLL